MDHRLELPDLMEPVIGYRSWLIKDGKLVGPWKPGSPWKPGKNKAFCTKFEKHPRIKAHPELPDWKLIPHPLCECGLYAYSQLPNQIVGSWSLPVRAFDFIDRGGLAIPGAVKLEGRIEVHKNGGVRAEYATPILLATQPWHGKKLRARIEAVAKAYDLGVVRTRELEYAAALQGGTLDQSFYAGAKLAVA